MGRAVGWTAGLLATILFAGGCDLADPLLIASETEEIFYVQKPEISSDGRTLCLQSSVPAPETDVAGAHKILGLDQRNRHL
jgi:hypothetical protein